MSSTIPISSQSTLLSTPLRSLIPPTPIISSLQLEASPGCSHHSHERDLNSYLDAIWQRHFSDLPRANEVQIAYCRPWKTRLGLIRMSLDQTISFIGINSLLRSSQVPECVLVTTIAHELVHYAHGFGSPLPRLYEHPHAGRVVEKDLEQRGLGTLLFACDTWIEDHWYDFYAQRRLGMKKSA